MTLEDVQSVEVHATLTCKEHSPASWQDEVLDEEQVRKSTSSSGAMPDTYAG